MYDGGLRFHHPSWGMENGAGVDARFSRTRARDQDGINILQRRVGLHLVDNVPFRDRQFLVRDSECVGARVHQSCEDAPVATVFLAGFGQGSIAFEDCEADRRRHGR